MRITLFLQNELFDFVLPTQILGSFSFDSDLNEESKLINVEARDGKWVLYKTPDVDILFNNTVVDILPLEKNKFYYLRRDNKNYVIYVSPTFIDNFNMYSYDQNINLIIGNTNIANIQYTIPYLNNINFNVVYQSGGLLLKKTQNALIYVNKKAINVSQYNIKIGDEIQIYGLRIYFLNGFVFINNISNQIKINEANAHLIKYVYPPAQTLQNIEVKDVDLYDKDDYFSKSPRLRRIIETKDIKFSAPPSFGEEQKMPLILVVGPMLTMGAMSMVTCASTIIQLNNGSTTMGEAWPNLLMGITMLISTLIWPIATNLYNKKMTNKKKEQAAIKYRAYLKEKEKEIKSYFTEQKEILFENLITIDECLEHIQRKGIKFWDKRNDQSDFLTVRLGIGKVPLDAKIELKEEEFSLEADELKKEALNIIEEYKYIDKAPVGYSFYDNKTTAIMGSTDKAIKFMHNILLQLLTFYSYEDLKIVVLTNEINKKNWDYVKYLNHNFSNDRNFRFFGEDADSIKNVMDYLSIELNNRIKLNSEFKKDLSKEKPYYFIIIDDYEMVKSYDLIKQLIEVEENIGFSIAIIEDSLSKLPSRCNNFITIGVQTSGVLKNSFEKQEQLEFVDEIKDNIDMMKIARILSNIPIEFEEASGELPDAISFLEMEKVGKVEQLNVLNRWNTNDSTNSLKAEIGVDSLGNLMYLDLHEKYHGPHGLIAGTTGSGKSEFIITYILSMAMNYSPDDVSFILIDYKGGGLAGAFENSMTGVYLPHLAGTITNLDKAEMDRTLVSIDSELKRRQQVFNEARDLLGESTIDIYKYQRFYKDGRLKEPVPHLFIICDEFAELKAQQPDFMDNLISAARIGRSLGVHLILATQKPSGVVNDQIWSNTKFRVCLKVQDSSDSMEMLKRPDAAGLKQTGRFYLQVGYDEYFALGQSGWCGAKYYPSEKIIKQVDKSVNFINSYGGFIKSIQGVKGIKIEPQGEQISAVLKSIIEVANITGKKAKRLWLPNIPTIITEENIEKKYSIEHLPYQISAVLGEYDAPEKQEQGIVLYDFLKDGNTIIYGNDGAEREMLINTLIYSSTKNHKVEELNYYIIDYGSESLRRYQNLPHIGGIVFEGEEEKLNNLMKLLNEEIQKRKNLFSEYGGEYQNYIKNSGNKLPLIAVIFNNYDSISEANQNLYDDLPSLVRDSERYGIIFIIGANAINSIYNKISQNFNNYYTFKLNDTYGYSDVFNDRTKLVPRDIFGRGLFKNDDVHEFQTASIIEDENNLNDYIINYINEQKQLNQKKAKSIPSLPKFVRLENVINQITNLKSVPIGIDKNDLETLTFNYLENVGNIISSNKLENMTVFTKSFLELLSKLQNTVVTILDPTKTLGLEANYSNYYVDDMNDVLEKLITKTEKMLKEKSEQEEIIVIYGFNKFVSKLDNPERIKDLLDNLKKYEKMSIIILDDVNKIKQYSFEMWFNGYFDTNNGIWIGRGISDQSLFKVSTFTKEMQENIKNDRGYFIVDGLAKQCKLIDFISEEDDDEK